MRTLRCTLVLLLTFVAGSATAQTMQQIEQDLLRHFNKISYWKFEDTTHAAAYDSIEKENQIFTNLLLRYTSDSRTLDFAFADLSKAGVSIAGSADKKFRVYSWNTWTGGTMRIFNSVYQYESNHSVYSKISSANAIEGDAGCWFSNIFTMDVGGKQLYLGYWHAIFSSSLSQQGIKLFTIDHNGLNDSVKLIKTSSRIANGLSFEFDFFSVAERKERPVELVYCDEKAKTIKIPVVRKDLTVTKKFITYQFTGKYFEKLK